MKKTTGYLLTSIFTLIAGICFLFAAIFQEQTIPKYGFFFAAICLLISSAGFLHTHLKAKKASQGEKR